MQNFIILCDHLRSLQNFCGVMSVISGLSMAAIGRLKHTQKEISPKISKILVRLKEEMDLSGSFRNYREILKDAQPPLIPFL